MKDNILSRLKSYIDAINIKKGADLWYPIYIQYTNTKVIMQVVAYCPNSKVFAEISFPEYQLVVTEYPEVIYRHQESALQGGLIVSLLSIELEQLIQDEKIISRQAVVTGIPGTYDLFPYEISKRKSLIIDSCYKIVKGLK